MTVLLPADPPEAGSRVAERSAARPSLDAGERPAFEADETCRPEEIRAARPGLRCADLLPELMVELI